MPCLPLGFVSFSLESLDDVGRTPGQVGLNLKTPLLVAAKNGNADMMRALIEAKADQTVMFHGTTAIELLLLATAAKQGDIGHAIALSAADVNTRNAVRRYEQGQEWQMCWGGRCSSLRDGREHLSPHHYGR
jgi:ankyrin repeat protein